MGETTKNFLTFGDDEKALKLTVVMVTQIYDYLKTIELHTLNVYELCPNKALM